MSGTNHGDIMLNRTIVACVVAAGMLVSSVGVAGRGSIGLIDKSGLSYFIDTQMTSSSSGDSGAVGFIGGIFQVLRGGLGTLFGL